ncbi:MAG: alpha/beta hydrolase [Betaproteobacteria bacterium]|jgi:putative phosphoribosyl transferase|nr:alpha/beta hydrolase [Betaproteobacteria bacterium]
MLDVPADAAALVVFAQGSGSSRHDPRNRIVANTLCEARLATLLMDLLTAAEDRTYESRFDIGLLTTRLSAAVRWAGLQAATASLPLGIFGTGTGAAAALQVAAALRNAVGAVVCRSGRPDLASRNALGLVKAPTLFIVGGADKELVPANERAFTSLRCGKEIALVSGATNLFEEPGALEKMTRLSADWFTRHLVLRSRGG